MHLGLGLGDVDPCLTYSCETATLSMPSKLIMIRHIYEIPAYKIIVKASMFWIPIWRFRLDLNSSKRLLMDVHSILEKAVLSFFSNCTGLAARLPSNLFTILCLKLSTTCCVFTAFALYSWIDSGLICSNCSSWIWCSASSTCWMIEMNELYSSFALQLFPRASLASFMNFRPPMLTKWLEKVWCKSASAPYLCNH